MFFELAGMKSRIKTGIFFALIGTACAEAPLYKAKSNSQRLTSEDIAIYTGSPCSSGGKQYELKATSSLVTWQVNRKLGAKISPFTGTNTAVGGIGFADGNLRDAKGVFNFLIESTDTSDPLRDDRIIGYLFRANQPDVLRFEMNGFKEDEVKVIKGGTVNATVTGTFQLDKYSTEIEIPVSLREADGVLTVSTVDSFKLNVRNSVAKNGFDLSEPIAHLLTLVSGVDIEDEIDVKLNLSMENSCKE